VHPVATNFICGRPTSEFCTLRVRCLRGPQKFAFRQKQIFQTRTQLFFLLEKHTSVFTKHRTRAQQCALVRLSAL